LTTSAAQPTTHGATPARAPSVAIVHDWLYTWAGAERVLARMLALFPDASLFTTFDALPAPLRDGLQGRVPRTTWLQRLPGIATRHRAALPLMPAAIASLDLRGFDLVLSSSHAVAKGVRVPPGARHVCYCHTPMRYAWDLRDEYLDATGWTGVTRQGAAWLLDRLRAWDRRTADGVHDFVANSAFVAARIARNYGREAAVIHPPVDVDAFTPGGVRGGHFVTAGRLVPYKRVDLMVEAFRARPDLELRVVGDGPQGDALRRTAPANVRFLGRLPHEALVAELRGARAFLFGAEEDFGIAPLEAQACGTPVLAYRRGAVEETMRALGAHAAPTAVLFEAQEPGSLLDAIARFERDGGAITADACRANAMRFATARFDTSLHDFIAARVPGVDPR
jgi:glycosyltransferase involved in cell wall biosynthesis